MPFNFPGVTQRQDEVIRKCIESELLAAQEMERSNPTHNDSWFLYCGAIPRLKEALPSDSPVKPVKLAFKNGKLGPRV